MKTDKVYPKGILTFQKHENAPDFVMCSVIIDPNALYEWLKGEGKEHLKDYKGTKQLNLQITNWQKKPSISVNNFTAKAQEQSKPTAPKVEDDLPF